MPLYAIDHSRMVRRGSLELRRAYTCVLLEPRNTHRKPSLGSMRIDICHDAQSLSTSCRTSCSVAPFQSSTTLSTSATTSPPTPPLQASRPPLPRDALLAWPPPRPPPQGKGRDGPSPLSLFPSPCSLPM